MNTLRAFLFVLYTTAIVQANGQPVTPIIVDIPYQNPTSVKMNGMVKSIPEAEQFLQDTSSKFGRFDPIVIRLESNEDIYAAAVFARVALKSHDSVYIALKKPDKADAGYYLLPVGSNEATFTSSGASFPETQPTSIKADILVYKVESATTKKQYTWVLPSLEVKIMDKALIFIEKQVYKNGSHFGGKIPKGFEVFLRGHPSHIDC